MGGLTNVAEIKGGPIRYVAFSVLFLFAAETDLVRFQVKLSKC